MEASPTWAPRLRRLTHSTLDAVDRALHRVFVSHQGTYSVARLGALNVYCQQTSRAHVPVVCALLTLPAFLISIALELIPLQNPADGWRENYGCWVRLYCISFFVAFGAILQSSAQIPDLQLSLRATVCAALAPASIFIAILNGFAALWVFPTPFAIVISAVPFALTTAGFFILAVGPRRLAPGSSLRLQVVQRMYMFAVQATLMVVYPSFSIAYFHLPQEYKSEFLLVLPLIKIAMQHLAASAMRDLQEAMPVNVVFCVGVFNALYMSKCMQNAGSRLTYAVVLSLDAIQGIYSYRQLHKRMLKIRLLASDYGCTQLTDSNLLHALVQLSQELQMLGQSENSINLESLPYNSQISHLALARSATSYSNASRQVGFFSVVYGSAKVGLSPGNQASARPTQMSSRTQIHAGAAVYPAVNESADQQAAMITNEALTRPCTLSIEHTAMAISKARILRITLKLLFECEYNALVEYVKSAIPIMYAMYVAIVGNLSSAQYYPETRGKTPTELESMVLDIAMYASVQMLSMFVMQAFIQRRSGLSSFYIVAFVIETQGKYMLGQLFVWYVALLQLTLAHFGTCLSIPLTMDML